MYNPITYDTENTKKQYLELLIKYLKIGRWNRRKYVLSEIEAYKKIIFADNEVKHDNKIDYYKYFILFDVLHFLGYSTGDILPSKLLKLRECHAEDFVDADKEIVKRIIISVRDAKKRLTNLLSNDNLIDEKEYIKLIRRNLVFRKIESFDIMVTATMSAGKSTFINALIGKYVCLSQNMACTSKIHSIINKAFEDGYSSEYDHDLVMTAGKEELLNDNEDNASNMIYVATHYAGELCDSRIIIHDSPGVNFSGNKEHQMVAHRLIKRKNYGLLFYVMNATQLRTNDDEEHLEFVKKTIGTKIPVIFILNKVDSINYEEENVEDIIRRQVSYLQEKGFDNPIVCPVSARAGYLSKQSQNGTLSKSEQRELYNLVDKFEEMNLEGYYNQILPDIEVESSTKEEVQLQKTCGLKYIERLIIKYLKGGIKDVAN